VYGLSGSFGAFGPGRLEQSEKKIKKNQISILQQIENE
jgi:hypothetical protein